MIVMAASNASEALSSKTFGLLETGGVTNDLVYQSKFNFEPIINKIYHLYYSTNGSTFLSLVEPHEWNKEHIGSFRYNHDNKWIKL